MTEVRRYPVLGAGVGREDYAAPVLGPNAKEMRTERRSTTSNDNGVVDGVAPPAFYTAEVGIGKFYTRGCRGMIEELQIYCIRTGAGTLTLRYSPHPCLGPLGEVVITPGATWAWVGAVIEEMWNYDSLFIWVHLCSADVSWAFDTVLPFDGHEDTQGNVPPPAAANPESTWINLDIRPFIRAVYTGETGGDVPVSGIVNTIRIPSTTLEGAVGWVVNVPSGVITDIILVEGAGELVQVEMQFNNVTVPAAGVQYMVILESDGQPGITVINRQLTQSVVAAFGRCAMGEFMQTATQTWMWVRLPIQYRRRLLVRAFQTTGAPVTIAALVVSNELT